MPVLTTEGLQAAADDASTLGGVQWAIAAGTVNAITGVYPETVTALYDGLILGFRASGANTSATPTFGPDGLTQHTIVKAGGQALAPGDIPAALAEMLVRYNLANTHWELLNPATSGDTAWANYTPTITAASGTITTSSGTIRWRRRGKVVELYGTITITTNGTGAGNINFTLPVVPAGTVSGNGYTSAPVAVIVIFDTGSGGRLFKYDSTYPGVTGQSIVFSGSYEIA